MENKIIKDMLENAVNFPHDPIKERLKKANEKAYEILRLMNKEEYTNSIPINLHRRQVDICVLTDNLYEDYMVVQNNKRLGYSNE